MRFFKSKVALGAFSISFFSSATICFFITLSWREFYATHDDGRKKVTIVRLPSDLESRIELGFAGLGDGDLLRVAKRALEAAGYKGYSVQWVDPE